MKKITKLLALVGMSLTANLQSQVFFSEYGEGTSNNKYLEIYNASESEVNLEDYLLINCSNGCKNDGIKGAWQMSYAQVGSSRGASDYFTTTGEETLRACQFDDYIIFHNDGVFQNDMGGETFLEDWQGGSFKCGTPAAPFDGSKLGTWRDNGDGSFTIFGQGSHVGFPKVHNGGETTDGSAKDSITYQYTITNDSSMVIEIEVGGGAWWTFHYVKAMNTYEYDNSSLFQGKTLKAGEVFVIAHGSAQADILAKSDVTHNFLSNGNDWYALWKKSDRSFIDEIGENTNEDNDPSKGWDVAGVTEATADNTLVRKSYVKMGSAWNKSAGTTSANSEWIVADKPTADYVSSDLGSFNTPVGAWKMIYLGVGGSKGDGSWYNNTSDATATDIILSSNGDFQNYRGGCVKPDNGSWIDNEDGTFTVIGKANFVGIHKVFNGGETSDGSAANKDSITYEYVVYGKDTLQVDIEIVTGTGDEGWWRFLYVRRDAPTPMRAVKFSVDMSGETVSSNGIHVAGNFQGWSPSGTAMTDAGNGIYEVHACVDANTVVEYKFINDNDWGTGEEKIPAISQKGHSNNGESNGNRWFYSGSGSDTLMLPAIVFGGSAPSGQHAVRFAVDMKNETVSSNGVHLAGSLQNWNPGKDQMVNLYSSNSIYEIIFCLADGSYEYKFVNDNNWDNGGAESVPSSCATNGNRGLTVSGSDVAEKLVCFGSCDACPGAAIPKVKVTFQVDMANECDVDGVDIAGGKINGWSGGDMLTKMAENICGVPVAPHDGSNAGNWTDNGDGTFSVNGKGNFIGLPKVYTGGEISNPADAKDTITYEYTITSGDQMSVYCPIANGAYWQFDLQKATSDSMLSGSWNMTFMGVGPSKGDVSWYNTAIDENNRPCMADDQFNLNSDGSFTNVFGPTTWIEGWQLVKPDVYFITLELDSGVEIEHKFRKITNVDTVDFVSWEPDAASGGNYKVTAHSDTIIAARCFGKEEACSGTPLAPADITFTVDLSQEIPADTVWIMGSFTVPQWQAGAIALEQDATNSDLYTVTVENVCADKMSYKFANETMNSSTNGETFPDSTDRSCVVDNGQGGWNRTLTRTDDQDIIVSYTYNTCQPASSANTTDLSTEMIIAPNPANGIFTVKLAGSKINYVEILSIDGRTIRSYNANSISTSIDATGLNGIFLVKVSDNIGRTAIKKIVLQ